jgi:hypothetical protein
MASTQQIDYEDPTWVCRSCDWGEHRDYFCKKCDQCETCCISTMDDNGGLCNEEDIRAADELAWRRERRQQNEQALRLYEEKTAFVKELGSIGMGICHCHGQCWIFTPKDGTKKSYCGYQHFPNKFEIELLALSLGYRSSERAIPAKPEPCVKTCNDCNHEDTTVKFCEGCDLCENCCKCHDDCADECPDDYPDDCPEWCEEGKHYGPCGFTCGDAGED